MIKLAFSDLLNAIKTNSHIKIDTDIDPLNLLEFCLSQLVLNQIKKNGEFVEYGQEKATFIFCNTIKIIIPPYLIRFSHHEIKVKNTISLRLELLEESSLAGSMGSILNRGISISFSIDPIQTPVNLLVKEIKFNHSNKLIKLIHKEPVSLPPNNEIVILKALLPDPYKIRKIRLALFNSRAKHYITMPKISGKTLDQRQQDIFKKPSLLSWLFYGLLLNLSKIHQKNIVHHDLKPSNILFNDVSCTTAIIDYGLSSQKHSLESKVLYSIGSPVFYSPEKLKGNQKKHISYTNINYEKKFDAYALALCFSLILLPFEPKSADTLDKMYQISQKVIPLDNQSSNITDLLFFRDKYEMIANGSSIDPFFDGLFLRYLLAHIEERNLPPINQANWDSCLFNEINNNISAFQTFWNDIFNDLAGRNIPQDIINTLEKMATFSNEKRITPVEAFKIFANPAKLAILSGAQEIIENLIKKRQEDRTVDEIILDEIRCHQHTITNLNQEITEEKEAINPQLTQRIAKLEALSAQRNQDLDLLIRLKGEVEQWINLPEKAEDNDLVKLYETVHSIGQRNDRAVPEVKVLVKKQSEPSLSPLQSNSLFARKDSELLNVVQRNKTVDHSFTPPPCVDLRAPILGEDSPRNLCCL